MKITIQPGKIAGEIAAIPSKSHLHRLLIYAAFADRDTLICCRETEAEDINATINCLTALGAKITRKESGFVVTPVDRKNIPQGGDKPVFFPCGESGSTLRFMLPVVCALGVRSAFEMKGRLPERPLAPLDEQLEKHGIRLWRDTPEILQCEGKLQPGDYYLPGNISSQYISGILMAMALLETPGRLTVSAPIESAGYIEMTLNTAEIFGQKVAVKKTSQGFEYDVGGTLKSPGQAETEGDWSNSAFWLCAGAMPGGNVKLNGLLNNSSQGDREVFEILSRMGATIRYEGTTITVTENERRCTEIDARAIPDLIPVLAAVATVSSGTTVVSNAARLRIKESDRLMAVTKTLSIMGANIKETAEGLIIKGVEKLRGGTIDAHGDHRIPMMAAIASTACTEPVTVIGAQAVNKSYPEFWNDLRLMGKTVTEE
ncbi:MAG: 3-phosphoshikimate 1-carboxyvinyltransferase [Defluviitaleaceae bacterium]|nr:3-phosphoshikimate 1-carboxyvinyltransferase [Defluviitaleaceae bacterium]